METVSETNKRGLKRIIIKGAAVAVSLFLCQTTLAQNASDGLIIPPFVDVPERTPAFPLKTSRSLYSDQEVEMARNNIGKYASAQSIQKEILKLADYWLEFTQEELLNAMPDARVPRGFDLCAEGCPVHGDSVFKVNGHYPWVIDPKRPFRVECPIGGEVYPSNDYAHYYNGGLKEKPIGRYADDGWGWVSPEGDRYWFVAHAVQWTWYRHTVPGLLALSRAYLLTGNTAYAERAAFMLYRLAQIYPAMDHENQSRYGLMEKMKGNRYSGKILNRIWETQLIKDVAEAYDHVWDHIDRDTALQTYSGKSGEKIRAFIEANVLEDGLDGIASGKIAGNFGMHQNSMLYLHLVRQHAGKDEAIEKMVETPARNMAQNGLRYAIYNQVFRDGMPLESPGYNAHWLKELVSIGEVLKKGGKDIFSNTRFKSLLDAPIDLVAIGKYTPDWGDGGSVTGGLTARYPEIYQIGYNEYQDKRYLHWIGKSGDSSFSTFGSLFLEALPATAPLPDSRATIPAASRLFAGYGLGVLNNPSDKTALALTYGMHYSHYHWDFLNIELFANGRKMMPDLGYPDAMNTYVSPVYTWSKNTISHNTVVIDKKKQTLNLPGTLHDFFEGEFARVADVSSPAYEQASQYRRKVFLVDAGNDQSYVVDFFQVAGGRQHDYSLHGPPGTVVISQDQWSDPAPGTLAGNDVALEDLYDDPELKINGMKTGYARYGGSGFQHLFNVQKRKSGNGQIEYHHIDDASARLRLHTLTPEMDELIIADAYDLPRAKAYTLKYLIARRKSASSTPLKSTFTSIFEPYKDTPLIINSTLQTPEEGNGQVVVVERATGKDLVIQDTTRSIKRLKNFDIETDASSAVVTFDNNNRPVRVFFSDGNYLKIGGEKYQGEELRGVVEKIDIDKKEVTIRLTGQSGTKLANATTRVAHFTNNYHVTVHPVSVTSQNKTKLILKVTDDLLVGKLQLEEVNGNTLKTNTSLTFQRQYGGVALLNEKFQPVGTVIRVDNQRIEIAASPTSALRKNEVLWLSNVGPGDEFVIKSGFSKVLR